MQSVITTVGELKADDRLLLPKTRFQGARIVEITRLQSLRNTGRIRVYVRSIHHQRSMFSGWSYGAFDPSHPIEMLVD